MQHQSLARYSPWLACIAFSALLGLGIGFGYGGEFVWVVFSIFTILSLIGLKDVTQTHHAILRNYPLSGHLRFLIEYIRPEIRQYLIESDNDEVPFSRAERALVYQRAKGASDKRPFGTLNNLYQTGSEVLLQKNHVAEHIEPNKLRVTVGGNHCTQPYAISLFNISAMSFGALSANAIMALNKGAKKGGFAHDTGEGSVSDYHRKFGGDLIWELGSGYFGCRTATGHFDPEKFKRVANETQIKMIEIKISQGAKPGHGGVLPAAKITPEIAQARGVPMGEDCVSPAMHSAYSSPKELLQFVQRLRELSAGKPVGFKLCIGHIADWFGIVKAMLETKILPDFIVVDGSEGGTGAAPVEFVDNMGMPMYDGLRLVHTSLVGAGFRDQIRLGAAGKITSAFDIVRVLATGADWCNSARGFMFAIGCIQSRSCHTDHCPTGVATQDALRQKALDPIDKAERVFHFHHETLTALSELLAAAGIKHVSEVTPEKIMKRHDSGKMIPLSKQLIKLDTNALLSADADLVLEAEIPGLGESWREARADQW